MKLQVKTAFKSYFFVTKKVIKKQTGSAWKFLQPLIPVCWGAYIPSFKISVPFFCCTLFSKNYLNPQVRINKMVNKHIVDYHPILSQLISRIHSYFFGLNISMESKNWTCSFSLMLQCKTRSQVFIITSQAEGNYSFLSNSVFWRSIFSRAERWGEDYGVEKITKIKPTRRVLVTSFDKFHHLCNLNIFGFCFAMP